MKKKKQSTAISHLLAYLSKMGYYRDIPSKLIEEAIRMEKEQMFAYTRHRSIIGHYTEDYYNEDFEKFYEENYATPDSR